MKLTSDNPLFNKSFNNDLDTKTNTTSQQEPVSNTNQPLKKHSVIGGNIKFRGELIGTEDIHIEGSIEGTIIMKGHNLTVGEQGVINANVRANNIIINGKLTGDLLADELISIKKTAVVKGNLIAPRIQLDDGGKFRGSMDMIDNDQEKKDRISEFDKKLVHPHLPNDKNASIAPSVSTPLVDNKNASYSPKDNNDNKDKK